MSAPLSDIKPEAIHAAILEGYLPTGEWSITLKAARCPHCGNMTPLDGPGSLKKGRVMPVDGNTVWRHLYCRCGESFKARQVDPTLPRRGLVYGNYDGRTR